jgi:hypothetical protein
MGALAYRLFSKDDSCDFGGEGGAGGRNRTRDLMITNQLLYQLSYTG